MVVLLLALTVIALLAVDFFLRRRYGDLAVRPRAQQLEAWRTADSPAQLLHHPGHSWVRVGGGDAAAVGASTFAANFAGRLAKIELPRVGDVLKQGQAAWTLISERKRRLTQPMPVDGEILEVNTALVADPQLAQLEPYEDGWILRVRPRGEADRLHNLLEDPLGHVWDDAMRLRLNQMLSPALGARANDGGEWVPGFGDELSDEDWESLKRELFPAITKS